MFMRGSISKSSSTWACAVLSLPAQSRLPWPPQGFEGEGHQAWSWVPKPFSVLCSGRCCPAALGPPPQLLGVCSYSVRYCNVYMDPPSCGIRGNNVQSSVLHIARVWIHPVPPWNVLLVQRHTPRGLWNQGFQPIPDGIVSALNHAPFVTRLAVMATGVEHLPAQSAIMNGPVLAVRERCLWPGVAGVCAAKPAADRHLEVKV